MDALPTHNIVTYLSPDPLPPEAVELFGHEIADAWGNDPALPQSAAIAATTDGEWLAGVFMLLETLESNTPSQPATRVASIRHLIVPPAHRGRGLAGRLLRRALTLAAEAKCTRIRSTAGFGCPDHALLYDRLRFQCAQPQERPYLVTRAV